MTAVDLYQEIVALRERGERAAVATIVRRLGSTPRKDAAKMLIREDGTASGTVGGGCVEAEVWQVAKHVIETGRPRLVQYELTEEDAENEGLICGGTVEIFVEPIVPDPHLLILGAGHLGQAICRLAAGVGFQVTVMDDRPDFASPDRFPEARELRVQSFESTLEGSGLGPESFILIVTRGHRHDQLATEQAIRTDAGYVGLVGSRRKIKLIVEALLEKGYGPERFRNLYAPIGLPIGSDTPEEIAVSVVAELIAIRKGVHRRSEKQEFIMNCLATPVQK